MRPTSEVRAEVRRIINKSFTAEKATEDLVEFIKHERAAMIEEINGFLDTTDFFTLRALRRLRDLEERNRG